MGIRLYVGNLSRQTTHDELKNLFKLAGEVTATEVIKDNQSGESKGFAFITMNARNEANRAVSMFNEFSWSERVLEVSLAE